MTARRPYVEIPGTPPKLKENVDGDPLIVAQLVTAAGLVYADPNVVPYPTRQRVLKQWIVNPGTNTWQQLGFAAAPTTSGTLSTGDTNTGAFVTVQTAGVGSGHGEVRGDYTQTRVGRLPILSTLVRTPASISKIRLWCGLSLSALTGSLTNNAAEHIAFRYDADNDSKWVMHTSNGSANTSVDSGVVVAVSTEYLLEVAYYGGNAIFMINGALVGTFATTLPQAASNLGPYACIDELSAGPKTFGVGMVSLWTR